MKTIQINNLNFDLHDGPVGIAHSGGADSAIMLCVLMKYVTGPIHVYTCANSFKQRRNPVIALRVIDKLLDITGRTDVYHHTYFTERQTFNTLFDPLNDVIIRGDINMLYTAVTANPPQDILTNQQIFTSDNGLSKERDAGIIRPKYNGPGKKVYSPWWNVDKRFIATVYNELSMTETLFPITRSCEDPSLLEGHCGICWWCEERKWAFGSK
jgi:7-cyano-7-deazaguanine synthase in queuosine biosynthesis